MARSPEKRRAEVTCCAGGWRTPCGCTKSDMSVIHWVPCHRDTVECVLEFSKVPSISLSPSPLPPPSHGKVLPQAPRGLILLHHPLITAMTHCIQNHKTFWQPLTHWVDLSLTRVSSPSPMPVLPKVSVSSSVKGRSDPPWKLSVCFPLVDFLWVPRVKASKSECVLPKRRRKSSRQSVSNSCGWY